jgi:hypothetical protein
LRQAKAGVQYWCVKTYKLTIETRGKSTYALRYSKGIGNMVHLLRSRIDRGVLIGLFAVSLLANAMATVPASASALVQTFPTPQAMLLSYYSAINLKAYPQAYGNWLAPTQSYADFASGYLSTDRVLPYFGDWQPAPANAPANELGRIPAVLFGYHTDGTAVAYNGCFFIGSNGSQGSNIWKIVNASFKQFGTANYFPTTTILNTALSVDCYGVSTAVTLAPADQVNAAPDKGQTTLINYYSMVNRHDYLSAYAQWLQPMPGPKPNGAPALDYRLAYADFVAGYADTVYAYAYLGAFNEQGASAGHGYLDGTIPAVLVGQHSDGSVVSYYGCYVLGFLQGGTLGIVSGTFLPIQTPYVLSGKTISNYLNIDCTTLNLQL